MPAQIAGTWRKVWCSTCRQLSLAVQAGVKIIFHFCQCTLAKLAWHRFWSGFSFITCRRTEREKFAIHPRAARSYKGNPTDFSKRKLCSSKKKKFVLVWKLNSRPMPFQDSRSAIWANQGASRLQSKVKLSDNSKREDTEYVNWVPSKPTRWRKIHGKKKLVSMW